VKLHPCGDFNVLIGRNNSGKSNILTSIEAFFSSIKPEIINTSPPLGETVDFYQKDPAHQISIAAVFRLTEDERIALLSEISEERPQVKTLLEDIETDIRLSICISINAPKKFAFVRSIRLLSEDTTDPRTLFEIDDRAAKELYEIVEGMERAEGSKVSLNQFLQSFDSDDFANAKRSRAREVSGPPVDFFLRRFAVTDPALISELVKVFHASESYDTL
jgi:predicted ATP-dependent endonuclease of OLD family